MLKWLKSEPIKPVSIGPSCDERLVLRYLEDEITLNAFISLTGEMPLGSGLTTRYMAMMRKLERIEAMLGEE